MRVSTLCLFIPSLLVAPAIGQPLATEIVTQGLERPIWITAAPGDPDRLFVIEKRGFIRVIENGVLLPDRFLDLDSIITGGTTPGSEQGLLGLAFHPDYQTNGLFYVNYTAIAGGGDTVVAEYQVTANPNIADPNSDRTILAFNQPQSNHNGGWMGFGSDGYLYISTGDGGNSNDAGPGHTEPGGNAQDITNNLLGKILRIDIDRDDFPGDSNRNYGIPADNPFVGVSGDDEIWDYGLRNPWRSSFDRETGDMWIADVGQSSWEEINFRPAGTSGGVNWGWRCREGANNFNFEPAVCGGQTLVDPVYEYPRTDGFSVTGGYVYRGCAIDGLQGTYFFADFSRARVWSFRYVDGVVTEFTERTAELDPPGSLFLSQLSSFGEDQSGELYLLSQDRGAVYRIVPAGGIVDCNVNGSADRCDILDGASDVDGDAVLDACEQLGDMNCDGAINASDIDGFVLAVVDPAAYEAQFPLCDVQRADTSGDTAVNAGDIDNFVTLVVSGW